MALEAAENLPIVNNDTIYESLMKNKKWKGKLPETNIAVDLVARGEYSLRNGLLYKNYYDTVLMENVSRLAVPSGGVRCYWFNGRKFNHSVRQMIIQLYHDSEAFGHHTSQGDTIAKVESMFWWPSLKSDVITHCRRCKICHIAKPLPSKEFGHFDLSSWILKM